MTWRRRTVAKGLAGEKQVARILQNAGYQVSRFVGSRGPFDLIAVGPGEIRLVQVKVGVTYLTRADREAIAALRLPAGTDTEFWRLPTLTAAPVVEKPIRPPGPRRQRSGVFAKPCTAPRCPGVIVEHIASHLARRKYCTRLCANRSTVGARFAKRRRKSTAVVGSQPTSESERG